LKLDLMTADDRLKLELLTLADAAALLQLAGDAQRIIRRLLRLHRGADPVDWPRDPADPRLIRAPF
jgi:hypothetical protein